MLSWWDKPVRIVSAREVAQKIAEMLKGTGVSIPENVVTPSLRSELEGNGANETYKTYEAYRRKNRKDKPIPD